jgi:hypothetical protein
MMILLAVNPTIISYRTIMTLKADYLRKVYKKKVNIESAYKAKVQKWKSQVLYFNGTSMESLESQLRKEDALAPRTRKPPVFPSTAGLPTV